MNQMDELKSIAFQYLLKSTSLEAQEIEKAIKIPVDNFFIDLDVQARIIINKNTKPHHEKPKQVTHKPNKKHKLEKRKIIIIDL